MPLVRVRGLEIAARGQRVVEGLDLEAYPGEMVLLRGGVGTGKSLAMKALAGIVHAMYVGLEIRGEISIDGLSPLEALRRRLVLYVNQDFGRFSPSPSIAALARILGVERSVSRRSLREMSVGEAYRVVVSMLVESRRRVLLVDEPSSHLDEEGLHEVLKMLRRWCTECGGVVVIADHEDDAYRGFVDHVIDVGEGIEPEPIEPTECTRSKPLKMIDLVCGYGSKRVVEGLNIVAEPGTIVAVVGPNGSGKTTLVRTLIGVLKPLKGRVDAPNRVFVLPQTPIKWFVHASIAEELKAFRIGTDIARKLGIHDPSRSPHTLSVGESRMLSIAIASLVDRPLIIVDELSLGLDRQCMEWLSEELRAMAQRGRVVLVTTHRRELASRLGDVVVDLEKARS